MIDAACLSADPDIFFPERGQPTHPARRVCSGCKVIDACAQYAEDTETDSGVWGGESWNTKSRHLKKRTNGEEAA